MALKKSELYSSLWKSCDELRGGMDASQYKDFVLILLFVKYVSDKYAGDPNALIDVPAGGGFADMVAAKGSKEIGDRINKIIGKLADANDSLIRAEESEKISAFDDMSLIQLIVERGPDAAAAKVKGVMKTDEAVAETIENNVRKLIINESPVDPAYYDKMSKLLDALIELRRKGVEDYKEYLEKIAALTKQIMQPGGTPGGYPGPIKTAAQRALYNNLGKDETLALAVDAAIQSARMDGWRSNTMKTKRVRIAIRETLAKAAAQPIADNAANQDTAQGDYPVEVLSDQILDLAKHQNDY